MQLQKLLLAGLLSTLTITACAPSSQYNSSEVQTSGEGIIGGWEAQPGDRIQQSIVAIYDSYEGQLCTGSLLPNNVVLTAAHCIGPDPEAMFVIFDTQVAAKSLRRRIDKVAISPYWAHRQMEDKDTGDIALVHFTGSVPRGYVPATFAGPNERRLLKAGSEVVLAGYGISNGATGDGAGRLRVTKVKIEDPKFSNSEITLNQTQGTGACHGDSGGPAYILVNGHHYLWGVTSRGVEDKSNDCSKLAAYTSALYYKTWINKMAAKLSSSLVNSL